jgi:hypothetical protein
LPLLCAGSSTKTEERTARRQQRRRPQSRPRYPALPSDSSALSPCSIDGCTSDVKWSSDESANPGSGIPCPPSFSPSAETTTTPPLPMLSLVRATATDSENEDGTRTVTLPVQDTRRTTLSIRQPLRTLFPPLNRTPSSAVTSALFFLPVFPWRDTDIVSLSPASPPCPLSLPLFFLLSLSSLAPFTHPPCPLLPTSRRTPALSREELRRT